MTDKPKKSPTIVTYMAENRNRWYDPGLAKALRDIERRYPHGDRAPLFCLLWDNHAEVEKLRQPPFFLTWHGVAMLAGKDAVVGRWGGPPTANSVRRVWSRVCQEKEERAARVEARAAEKRARRGG